MRRLLGLLAVPALLFGCNAVPAPQPSPLPSPTPSPAAVLPAGLGTQTVAGEWDGFADDRMAGSPTSCKLSGLAMFLAQDGSALTGEVKVVGSFYWNSDFVGPETLTGTFKDGKVLLAGTVQPPQAASGPVTYDLTYNPATHHLEGTRNGKHFYLVLKAAPETCPTLPPNVQP